MPVFAEFADHHRLPHAFVNLASGILAHPGIGRGFFKRVPVFGQFQVDPHQSKADFVKPEAKPWVCQRRGDGIEGVKLAFVVHDADRSGVKHLVGPA